MISRSFLGLLLCFLGIASAFAQIQMPVTYQYTSDTNTNSYTPWESGSYSNVTASDDTAPVVNIGFTFYFYNTPYTTCAVSSNGNIQFATAATAWNPTPMPSDNAAYNPVLAYFFTDLNPTLSGSGQIIYRQEGTAPNRRFVVRLDGVSIISYADRKVITETILYETSNDFEIRFYQIPETSNGVVIGVEKGGGVRGDGSYDYTVFWNDVAFNNASRASVVGTKLYFTVDASLPPPIPPTYAVTRTTSVPEMPALVNGISLPANDDFVNTVDIGFSFNFYNNFYDRVNISSNGELQFVSGVLSTVTPRIPGETTGRSPFIAFFSTNLYPQCEDCVQYGTSGAAPNRKFVLRLNQVPYYSYRTSTVVNGVTLDVILYEANNDIEIRYYRIDTATQYVTIGIQGVPILRSDFTYDYTTVVNYATISSSLATLNRTTLLFHADGLSDNNTDTGRNVRYDVTVQNSVVSPRPSYSNMQYVTLGDEQVVVAPLGFSYTFYGATTVDSVRLSSNGNIQFLTSSTIAGSSRLPTGSTSYVPLLAYYWVDLSPHRSISPATAVGYTTIGSEPNRQFVLQITNVPAYSYSTVPGLYNLTCDVILSEGTNAIEMRYYSVANATGNVTIGLESNTVFANNGSREFTAYWNHQQVNLNTMSQLNSKTITFTPVGADYVPPAPVPLSYNITTINSLPERIQFTNASYIPGADEGVQLVDLGFFFTFYGRPYTSIRVGSNGEFHFNRNLAGRTPGAFPLGNENLLPIMAFFFTDLNPSNSLMRQYQTFGVSPNRYFVMRWENVPYGTCSTTRVSFDVILYESNSNIEIRYFQIGACSSTNVVIGAQGSTARRSDYTYDYTALINAQAMSTRVANSISNKTLIFMPRLTTRPPTPLAPLIGGNSYTYNLDIITERRIELREAVPITTLADNTNVAVSLGFYFVFYGETFQKIVINSNGYFQFRTNYVANFPSSTPTGNQNASPFIAPYWADLDPSQGGSVVYGNAGTPGQRKFVIRYDNVPYWNQPTKPASFDLILFEEDNRIEIHYYTLEATTSSSILLGAIQRNASEYIYLHTGSLVTGNRVSFFVGSKLTFTPAYQTPAVPVNRFSYTVAKNIGSTTYQPLVGAVNLTKVDDRNSPVIQFGFSFPFYGLEYTYCSINSNGNIQFVTNNNFGVANPLPVGFITAPAIYFAWTNLYATANSIVQYSTNATTKVFTLRFVNVPYYSTAAVNGDANAPSISVDLILYGETGNIEMKYYRVDQTTSPVQIGIESSQHGDLSSEYLSYLNALPITSTVANDLAGFSLYFTNQNVSTPYTPRQSVAPVRTAGFSGTTYVTNYLPGVQRWANDNLTTLTFPTAVDSIQVNIGFNFQFFSSQYSTVYIDRHGILAFDAQPSGNLRVMPNPINQTTQYIAFAGMNFLNDVGMIGYALSNGTVGSRYFIVRFDRQYATQFWQETGVMIVDVLLYESDSRIEIRYYYTSPTYSQFYVGVVGSSTDYSYLYNGAWLSQPVAGGMKYSSTLFTRGAFTFPTPGASSYSQVMDNAPTSTPPTVSGLVSLPPSNDNIDTIRLAFGFTFFGRTYWALNISANGDIQFETAEVDYDPDPIPFGNVALAPFIAYFYTDLYPMETTSRQYGYTGTTPNRVFTLRLTNVQYFAEKDNTSPSTVSLDVNLYEFDSKIEVIYYSVGTSSQKVVIGIEGPPFLRSDYSPDFVAVRNANVLDSTNAQSLVGKRLTFTSNTPIPTAPFVPPLSYVSSIVTGTNRPNLPDPTVLNPTSTADDTVYNNIPIGFTFNFFGTDYVNVSMSSNGNIQFRTTGSSTRLASKLPSNHASEMPFIAAYLTDLYATAGDLKYQTIGSSPNRQFVARYDNLDRYNSGNVGLFSFDIILTETTNNIQIMYYSLGASGTNTILIGAQATQQQRPDGSYDYVAYWNAEPDTAIMRSTLIGNTLVFSRNTESITPPLPLTYSVARSTSIPALSPLTGATYIAGSDEGVDSIPIGFSFPFYDNEYSSVFVASNGNLQFATSKQSRWPLPLPYADPSMLPLFAFFFTDLNPSNDTMKSYLLSGSSPNRVLTIRFDRVPYGLCRFSFVTIDVKLYEVDTRLEVIYYSVDECRQQNVIIGLQKDEVRRSDYSIDYLTFANQRTVNPSFVSQLNGAMLTFRRVGAAPTPAQLNLFATGTYNVSQVTGATLIPISNPTYLPTGSAIQTASIGFFFTFYGIPYSQISVTSNGLVRFVGATSVTRPELMPYGNSAQIPFIALAFTYRLYYTSSGADRYYATVGNVGQRTFILRFDNAQYYSASGSYISADLILFEADSHIEMRYYSIDPTDVEPTLIGIQGPNSTTGPDYAYALNARAIDQGLSGLLAGTTIVFQSVVPIVPILPRAVTYATNVFTTSGTRETLSSPGYVANANDGVTGPVSIGFDFRFYDIVYDSVSISSNGNLQFASQFAGVTNSPMPLQSRTQVPMIAFAFSDLNINSSQAMYKTLGSSPNRYFIVRFNNVPYSHTSSQGVIDVDCVLFESDSHIEMRYYGISKSHDSMLIGLESHAYGDLNTLFTAYRNNLPISQDFATSLTGKTISFTISSTEDYVNGVLRPAVPTPYYQGTYNASIVASPSREVLVNPTTLTSSGGYTPTISLGFDFIFMGTSYNYVYFDTYGRLSFASSASVTNPSKMPFGNLQVAPFISFAWSYIYRFQSTSTYQYATTGTGADRRFILQISNAPYFYSPYDRAISVDIVLYAEDGRIELRYYRLDPISEQGLLIGIQGAISGLDYDYAVILNDAPVSTSLSAGMNSSTIVFRAVSGRAVVVPSAPVVVTYAISTMPTPALDVFTAPTNVTFTDDSVRVVPFGFSFRFFQTEYTSGNASSNGNMQFRTSATSFSPNSLPDGNPTLEPVLAMFWTDLAPNHAAGEVQYQTFGNPPDRRFVMRYAEIPYCCSATNPKVSFDLVLFETSNRIEIRFTNVSEQASSSSRNVLVGVDDVSTTPNGMPDFAVFINALTLNEVVASRLRDTTVVIQYASSIPSSSTGAAGPSSSSSSPTTPVSSSSTGTTPVQSSSSSTTPSSSSTGTTPVPSSSSSSVAVVDVGCPALTNIPQGSVPFGILINTPIDNLGPTFGSSFAATVANTLGASVPSNAIACGRVTSGDGRVSNAVNPGPGQSLVTTYVLANPGVNVDAVTDRFQQVIANGDLSRSLSSYGLAEAVKQVRCDDGTIVAEGEKCPGANSGSSGLSGGAIAGIVIGVIAGVVILAAVIFFILQRTKSHGYTNTESNKPGKSYVADEPSDVHHTDNAGADADEVELAHVGDDYAHEYSQNEMKTNDTEEGEHDETALV